MSYTPLRAKPRRDMLEQRKFLIVSYLQLLDLSTNNIIFMQLFLRFLIVNVQKYHF